MDTIHFFEYLFAHWKLIVMIITIGFTSVYIVKQNTSAIKSLVARMDENEEKNEKRWTRYFEMSERFGLNLQSNTDKIATHDKELDRINKNVEANTSCISQTKSRVSKIEGRLEIQNNG